MKLLCEDKSVHLHIQNNEKNSMLIVGGSRMGKTYFMSNFASDLIRQGEIVHLIDLGEKWKVEDKERLQMAGAIIQKVEKDGLTLMFNSVEELLTCAKNIVNALGIRSMKAVVVLKDSFKKALKIVGHTFMMKDLMQILESRSEDTEEKEWAAKICERLDCYSEIPIITFCINTEESSENSVIWDLDGLEDTYVQIAAYLIAYCLFCKQKRKSRNGKKENIFLIIDEFQVLSCDRRSIIGICLTEGQKYGLSLILATQFLDGNFSEAVINQFKQGGFRFYFRLTEEEAAKISGQLAYDNKVRKELCKKLTNLPIGNCMLVGPHSIGKCQNIVENFRFMEIKTNM